MTRPPEEEDLQRVATLVSDIGWVDTSVACVGVDAVLASLRTVEKVTRARLPVLNMARVLETAQPGLAAAQGQPLEPQRRRFLLALAACRRELPGLVSRFARRAGTPWQPCWIHTTPPLDSGRETGWVHGMAFKRVAERDVVAWGDDDGTIRFWDAESREQLAELRRHTQAVAGLAFGRLDERDILASASWDGTLRLWDVKSHEQLGNPLTTGCTDRFVRRMRAVAVGRAGERVVVVSAGNDGTVRLWDAATHEQLSRTADPAIRGPGR